MTRTIVSTIVSELATSALSPILAARFEFGSGHLRLWSGYGDLVFDPLGGVDFQVENTGIFFVLSHLGGSGHDRRLRF